ncbi:hypothetical protein [Phyllobacterium zundukense]|uniref:hypothetical protein n=1 Tax=Phyllobacterium zundukense TaxID=1867719 RepID=UPI0012FFD49C|nr:hypothetical protein [Phyllobacterium zundukense]
MDQNKNGLIEVIAFAAIMVVFLGASFVVMHSTQGIGYQMAIPPQHITPDRGN